MSDKVELKGGIGFLELLAIVFIVLKLTGVISWSWLWVLSPIWIPIALALTLLTFAGGIVILGRRARRK